MKPVSPTRRSSVQADSVPEKCNAFAIGEAPVDIIGTGSFLPERWTETYATADIVEYDGVPRVKVGREFLLRR